MAAQGPLSPGTEADDASIGTQVWDFISEGTALSQDDGYASASLTVGQETHYIKVTNFGFSIPAGSTIQGIAVEIERLCGNCVDLSICIVKGGAISATDKSVGAAWPVSDLDSYGTYGGASDLWGESWTADDINASNFGVVFSASVPSGGPFSARVDHVRITVTYTAPDLPTLLHTMRRGR